MQKQAESIKTRRIKSRLRKRRGMPGRGRPAGSYKNRSLMDMKQEELIELVNQGLSLNQISEQIRVHPATVRKYLQKHRDILAEKCQHEMPVKDGEEVLIEYETQPHLYSFEELKETVLKLNPASQAVQDNIKEITEQIYQQIARHRQEELEKQNIATQKRIEVLETALQNERQIIADMQKKHELQWEQVREIIASLLEKQTSKGERK